MNFDLYIDLVKQCSSEKWSCFLSSIHKWPDSLVHWEHRRDCPILLPAACLWACALWKCLRLTCSCRDSLSRAFFRVVYMDRKFCKLFPFWKQLIPFKSLTPSECFLFLCSSEPHSWRLVYSDCSHFTLYLLGPIQFSFPFHSLTETVLGGDTVGMSFFLLSRLWCDLDLLGYELNAN